MASESRPTAVVYCRTSTQGQKEAETIAAQIDRDTRIIERHGVKLLKYGPKKDGWILDDGVSGSLLEGRTFAKFVDDLEARKIRPDYLIVFSLSRIARLDKSSRDMHKLVKSHQDNGRIRAVLLGAGIKVLDEEGVNDPSSVMFDLKLTLSTEEYKLIRARTMAGKARKMSEGKFAKGGKPPYGYVQVFANGVDRKAGWTLAAHPEESKCLVQLLLWYVKGGITFAARKATEAGYLTPMASTNARKNRAADWSPTRWDPVSVQHIVRNVRAYLGETTYLFDGEAHVIKYPPIIDRKLFAAVERRKKEKVLKARATKLTTGFVDCVCGEHIHARNTHGRHWTMCPKGCGSIRERTFSSGLWDAIVSRLVEIRSHEKTASNGTDAMGVQLSAARALVSRVDSEIDKLMDLYLGGLDKARWKERNDVLNDRKAHALAEVERITRARDDHERKRLSEQSIEARIGALLDELLEHEPSLAKKREVLGDLLQGSKVLVSWPKRTKSKAPEGHVSLTFPAWGNLPPETVTVKDDGTEWVRKHGKIWHHAPGPAKSQNMRAKARATRKSHVTHVRKSRATG